MEMNTAQEKKLDNGLTLWYREGSSDLAVYKENEYYRNCFPGENDVIMDVGANIRDMPLKWGNRVKEIHCYEPMPDTFRILRMNIEGNRLDNCKSYEVALGHGDGEIEIWTNLKRSHAYAKSSTVSKRARTCITVKKGDFEAEALRIKPTIIKIDIEGGEREIIENTSDKVFESCHTFLLEIHPNMWKDGEEWIEAVEKRFKKIFGTSNNIGNCWFHKVHMGSIWKFSRNK